ncbi:MAG: GNAT family N-acetyltransferase [Ferrovibrio sp.]|uniref:GNAT family N-acetyltransferase n=1 Tax=Ferrovibrio sp. TaxID=1917215 RepID=UPI002634E3AA|nr:GNAT family N-acetyltransferase [Ferrovibrio sp.]MCW0236240.1 GNAT family N-acetyltransferase [Ferrovibrio sp.]
MPVSSRIEHRLRPADRNDLPRLGEIARHGLADAVALDLAALQKEENLFVAEWRTAIDGFIVLLPLQSSLLISRLVVAEEARGQGLGAWLLDCATFHARGLDLVAVEIQRPEQDAAGITWLTKRGFVRNPHGGNKVYLSRNV